ncbi:hypothetical protein ACTFIU_007082 [Dictyostelium citrinum]
MQTITKSTKYFIGKSLAACELFTVLATLINRYQLLNPTPSIPLNDKGKLCLSLHPPNVRLLIKKEIKLRRFSLKIEIMYKVYCINEEILIPIFSKILNKD